MQKLGMTRTNHERVAVWNDTEKIDMADVAVLTSHVEK